jgi:redox-sensitive bicupin YhaK (pirin superfamily)
LAHKDSTGGQGIIKAGDIQIMSAGSGVQHSEFNASATEPANLFQIWVFLNRKI